MLPAPEPTGRAIVSGWPPRDAPGHHPLIFA